MPAAVLSNTSGTRGTSRHSGAPDPPLDSPLGFARPHGASLPPPLATRQPCRPSHTASPFPCLAPASFGALLPPKLENPFPVARDGTIKLFQEAARAGVKHFVIVSVFNGAQLRHSVEAAKAKEQACDFVAEHAPSHGMRWTIVRPTGFFKDMDEMFRRTAATGKFLIVGDGKARLNPISGADLAERIALCISQRSDWNASVDVGGPEVFSLEQIGEMTFEALGRPTKFDRIPGFLLGAAASIFVPLQCCDPKMQQYADFARFASYVCTKDNVAPAFGRRRLAPHFARLAAVLKSDPELLDD